MQEAPHTQKLIDLAGLLALFDTLTRRGYEIVGPVHRDGAIVYYSGRRRATAGSRSARRRCAPLAGAVA